MIVRVGLALAATLLGACIAPSEVTCADGTVCPGDLVCAPAGGACVLPGQLTACANAEPYARCDVAPAIVDGLCVDGLCVARGCGDGYVDPASLEQCDEGAGNSDAPNAACRTSCQLAGCGDDIVDDLAGEACDQRVPVAGQPRCRGDCRAYVGCGNGEPDDGEACDDGNTRGGDGCGGDCQAELLGWTEVVTGTPSARVHPAMAYDSARHRVVLFGGGVEGPGGATFVGDTWDFDGEAWARRAPGTAPTPRYAAGAAFDSRRDRLVLFGGQGPGASRLGDLWEWDGETWAQPRAPLVDPGPPPMMYPAMGYDAARGETVLVGGLGVDGGLGDTWTYDGQRWTMHPTADVLGPRYDAPFACDPVAARCILFGGFDGATYRADTWAWDGTTWTDLALPPPAANAAGAGRRLVFDTSRGEVVLLVADRPYRLTDAGWLAVANVNGWGVAHIKAGVAYDALRRRLVVFGGATTADNAVQAQTWELDVNAQWTERLAPATPVARRNHALAYHAGRQLVVLFGGADAADAPLGDTWVFDGARWRQVDVPDIGGPPPREQAAMAYDPLRQRVVMFGGQAAGVRDDLWEFDGATWVRGLAADPPSARRGAQFVFDPQRGELVLYGGRGGPLPPTNDIHTYDGARWVHLATTPADPVEAPPTPYRALVVYDAARARLLVGGGDTGTFYNPWFHQLIGTTWSGAGTYLDVQEPDGVDDLPAVPLLGTGDTGLTTLAMTRAFYNPLRSRIEAISGDSYRTLLDGVAVLDPDGGGWQAEVYDPFDDVAVPRPAPRAAAGVAFDEARAQVVLFGGTTTPKKDEDDGATAVLRGDTWVLRYQRTVAPQACSSLVDDDDDGFVGCDDEDCWTVCTPTCGPFTPAGACPADGGTCGDNVCGMLEDCGACPQECFVPDDCSTVCGDGLCLDTETADTCPGDCAAL